MVTNLVTGNTALQSGYSLPTGGGPLHLFRSANASRFLFLKMTFHFILLPTHRKNIGDRQPKIKMLEKEFT
jgi:hypothetical protein